MTTETQPRVRHCPFGHLEALEFDPLLRQLRKEEPVIRISMPHGRGWAWLVTRYDDVRTVVTDHRFSRAAGIGRDLPRMTPEPIAQAEAVNLMDPPGHTRLRRLVAQGFTAPQTERMTPKIRAVVARLLDDIRAAGPPADFARLFAARLPLTTICEIMAIPEADQQRIRELVVTLMSTDAGPGPTREAKAALRAYFLELSAQRRARPGDDLISTLALARDGAELLGVTELAVMSMVLTISGHDTSTYQLSNIVYTLLTHPEQLALLRARPSLLEPAIEELLRFIPFRHGVGIARIATEDLELGGVTIRAGDAVHVSYLAANRDPDVFQNPEALDFQRHRPATHMTFGHGTHYCAGASLARAELRISLEALLAGFPGLRLAVPPEEVPWHTGSIWRYPERLPIAW
ncbi:cytochrome P450 [Pseudofrankia sp. DC12]|uniref:cytochrome P450 n=1 Tax=Pseudofrankia sp. DC12 TaxID=683315 RepID=UPI0005F7B851|nr:cytochrome P450 [Pseudofrankia sp. DC12]